MRRVCVFFICGLHIQTLCGVCAQPLVKNQIIFYDIVSHSIFLIKEDGEDLFNLTVLIPGIPTEFSPSPDGRHFALTVWDEAGNDAEIYISDLTGGNPINRIFGKTRCSSFHDPSLYLLLAFSYKLCETTYLA